MSCRVGATIYVGAMTGRRIAETHRNRMAIGVSAKPIMSEIFTYLRYRILPWTSNTMLLIIVLTPVSLHSCFLFYITLLSHSRGCLFRVLELGALIAYSDILSAHLTSRFVLIRSLSFLALANFL